MALKKEIENEIGQVSEYHRISSLEINFDLKQIYVLVNSYVSEKFRELEKNKLAEIEAKKQDYYLHLDDFNLQKSAYLVKEKEYKKIDDSTTVQEDYEKQVEEAELKSKMRSDLYSEKTELDMKENQLRDYNIQELEAGKVDKLYTKSTVITVPLTDDFREDLYKEIKEQIPDFQGSIDV